MVDEYLAHVEQFNEFKSFSMLSQDQIEKMQKLEINLKESITLEHEAISQVTKLESDLENVAKELHSLQCKRNKLESSIKDTKDKLEKRKADVSKIHEEMAFIESFQTKNLELLRSLLESSKDDL